MNWEMISAMGQLLGAIGVIISIIYLAAQIRFKREKPETPAHGRILRADRPAH